MNKIIDIILGGWSPITDTWTYNSTDNPTGVINWTGANSKVSAGMRIRFNNGGNTIYGIVTAVTGSTMTFLHEMNEANNNAVNLMANSAITNAFVSAYKAPLGFALNPGKWSVQTTDSTVRTQSTTERYAFYNIGGASSQIVVPIGVWRLRYKVVLWGSGQDGKVTLSTTNNSETIPALTQYSFNGMMAIGSTEAIVSPTSKVTYYLNAARWGGTISDFSFFNSHSALIISATSAYL